MVLNVYQVDSFTKDKFSGNPAGVVTNADGLSKKQMQQIARELNNSETAFILSPTGTDHDVWLKFFTPQTEVPICGHATIAAHYVRAIENKFSSVRVTQKTGVGNLPVDIIKDKDDYIIWMTQNAPVFDEPFDEINTKVLLSALGLTESDLRDNAPIQFISTGHGKVIVCINSKQKLNSLSPDFNRLIEISSVTEYKGFFVFTFDSDEKGVLTHARMFAPAIGINEDPVTGNGNGPAGAYIAKHKLVNMDNDILHYTGKQGEAIGRAGYIDVHVGLNNNEPESVKVGGRAVIAFKTSIEV